jgi:hypothetical protein
MIQYITLKEQGPIGEGDIYRCKRCHIVQQCINNGREDNFVPTCPICDNFDKIEKVGKVDIPRFYIKLRSINKILRKIGIVLVVAVDQKGVVPTLFYIEKSKNHPLV